jgi:hypothetical protein
MDVEPDIPAIAAGVGDDDPSSAPGTVAYGGVNPTLEGHTRQDALRAAIAHRRGSYSCDVGHANSVLRLSSPDEEIFSGKTLDEALVRSSV